MPENKIPKKLKEDLVQDVDGYYYFWPISNKGSFTAHNLRQIADELDRINAPWDKQINDYFEEEAQKEKLKELAGAWMDTSAPIPCLWDGVDKTEPMWLTCNCPKCTVY